MTYDSDTQKYDYSIVGTSGNSGNTIAIQFLFGTGPSYQKTTNIELGFPESDSNIIIATSGGSNPVSATTIQVSIRLTDERNRLLDLNGLHFQIAIQFDFDYKMNVIPPITKIERRGYMVDNSEGQKSSQLIKQAQQQKLMNELNLKKKEKRGRPRKVGRPKGTKIKNNEEI